MVVQLAVSKREQSSPPFDCPDLCQSACAREIALAIAAGVPMCPQTEAETLRQPLKTCGDRNGVGKHENPAFLATFLGAFPVAFKQELSLLRDSGMDPRLLALCLQTIAKTVVTENRPL